MEVKPSPCTHCGRMLDSADVVHQHEGDRRYKHGRRFEVREDETPTPNESFSVCISCGHVMMFSDDLTLRDLTDKEAKAIAGDPRLLAIQWARAKATKEKGPNCKHGIPRLLCSKCSVKSESRH